MKRFRGITEKSSSPLKCNRKFDSYYYFGGDLYLRISNALKTKIFGRTLSGRRK
ncbi:MAG: hypothetical protein WAM42_22470 [Candidatus Nitrosopolaris sp.]